LGFGIDDRLVGEPEPLRPSTVLNDGRGAKKSLRSAPSWFSTCPFSHPAAGAQAVGYTRCWLISYVKRRSIGLEAAGTTPARVFATEKWHNLTGADVQLPAPDGVTRRSKSVNFYVSC